MRNRRKKAYKRTMDNNPETFDNKKNREIFRNAGCLKLPCEIIILLYTKSRGWKRVACESMREICFWCSKTNLLSRAFLCIYFVLFFYFAISGYHFNQPNIKRNYGNQNKNKLQELMQYIRIDIKYVFQWSSLNNKLQLRWTKVKGISINHFNQWWVSKYSVYLFVCSAKCVYFNVGTE